MPNVFCNAFPCDTATSTPIISGGSACVYSNSYPTVYSNAHPCNTVNSITTEIPCDLEPKTLFASCGQVKTHRIVPTNEDGVAIDTQGVDLTFVIEDQNEFDLETGVATQNPPVGDPSLGADDVGSEIIFTSTTANDRPGEYRFAVRDVETNSPVCFGVLIVRYVPKIGGPVSTVVTPSKDPNNFELCITDNNDNPLSDATVVICTKQTTGPDGLVNFNLSEGEYTAEIIYNGQSHGITEFNV